MKSDLKITTEQMQGKVPVTVFHISGWLDAQSEGQLIEAAKHSHEEGAHYLLIDMSELDTLTSAGIRALQRVYQLFSKDASKGQHFKLCSAPPQIYNVLSITGFLQNIPMYENLNDALQTFGE
jgi:anti-anti-sigma factor